MGTPVQAFPTTAIMQVERGYRMPWPSFRKLIDAERCAYWKRSCLTQTAGRLKKFKKIIQRELDSRRVLLKMDYFYEDLNGNEVLVGTSDDLTYRQKVLKRDKSLEFDAYGLDVKIMHDVILSGTETIELHVLDAREIYYIDVDIFRKLAEVRLIGNEPMYCCPLSIWKRIELTTKR
jgi:hypothetical protein